MNRKQDLYKNQLEEVSISSSWLNMEQFVSYFFLYSLLNLCFKAETGEKSPEILGITNGSLVPSTMTVRNNASNTTEASRGLRYNYYNVLDRGLYEGLAVYQNVGIDENF